MEHNQLSLTMEWVELDSAEKMERGTRLANLIREAALQAEEHASRKKAMKEEREALEQQIAAVADVLRTGREERPIARERG